MVPMSGLTNQLPNGCRPDTPISVAPPPLKLVLPALHIDSSLPDVADQETPAKPLAYSRAASSPLTTLDEPSIPPSPVHSIYPASSPLSSPPLSPTCEQQQKQQEREYEHALPLPSPVVGIKRPASVAPEDTDGTVVDTASISGSASAPLARTHAQTKRRRREVDSDDKLWRNRKEHNPIPIPEPPASAPTSSTRPTSPPHVSSSTTTTAAAAACPTTPFSSSTNDPNPDEADEKETEDSDDFPICPIDDDDTGPPDPSHPHSHPSPHHHPPHHQPEKAKEEDQDQEQACPHPALLGILLETLALSRASSLPLTALTRTTPALATYPHAELTSTLAWAVRARILGCVRSSGEALPPSYFYDPAADPDRERGELLQCLMPRAGKRRETMKYKQYYWAPVVVGRGRTRTWDVDWEE
ncbi:hypothetical protein BGW80DRAFT_1449671 [Lactifluus volemus]|nr:hypothetical protein BGW80DRAFT_1449671 [Lactifluus volemus]